MLTEKLNGTTTSYAYDAVSQLTSDGTATYSYDANGNRTMTGYVTGTGNQLQNDGTWQYTYDSEGNLTEKFDAATGDIWDYTYNNSNQMASAMHTWNQDPHRGTVLAGTGSLQLTATYTYDAFGRRLEETVVDAQGGNQSADTRFAYDGQNVWADMNSSNALVMRRLYGDGVDQPVARVDGSGTAAWYLTDRLGSVRDIVNYAGTMVLDHLDYDGYGNVTNETVPASGDRYKYTAREFDSVTGLQYNRARYYDPRTGRWISQDSLGFEGGDFNLYRYVGNDPTDGLDSQGTMRWDVGTPKHRDEGGWWWQVIFHPEAKPAEQRHGVDERRGFLVQEIFYFAKVFDQGNQLIARTADYPQLFANQQGGTPVVAHFYELFYVAGTGVYATKDYPGKEQVFANPRNNDTFEFIGAPHNSRGAAFEVGVVYWDNGKPGKSAMGKDIWVPSDGLTFWGASGPPQGWSLLTSAVRPSGLHFTGLSRL